MKDRKSYWIFLNYLDTSNLKHSLLNIIPQSTAFEGDKN